MLYVALALVSAGACPIAALAGDGSCGKSSAVATKGQQAWTASQRLYYFDSRGRLLRSGFDGSQRRVVSERGFDPRSEINSYASSDGRHVAYGGNLAMRPVRQLWLLDTSSGNERLLLEGQPYSIGIPKFSMDGRRLAVDIAPRDDTPPKEVGFYIVDLDTGTTVFAGWPPHSQLRPKFRTSMFPAWSMDNRPMVSMIGDGPNGDRLREYWRYDLPSGRFERIDGRYNKETHEDEFQEAGRRIAIAPDASIPGMRGFTDLPSANGTFVARVDAKHRLEIQQGKSRRIAALGSYNDCEGVSLRLNGWVDGDRYLVFSNGPGVFIHDPRTGATAPLPLKEREVISFFFGNAEAELAPN